MQPLISKYYYMAHFNEHSLEIAIMELFEQQGYSYMNGLTRRINVIYGI